MHDQDIILPDPRIAPLLIEWYREHRREMPWRQTADPYRIWISEVILQQTRVAQGTEYYLRFTERFPNAASLAAAAEEEVLRYWQGLGYYSRARNLHAAARQVVERHGGVFPAKYEEVLALPGVGAYTAAAVCSICYGLPYATVDGNVYRVLSRLFDLALPIDTPAGRRAFAALAQSLLDPARPGLYNQAVMEFGALQCVPRSPRCGECPSAECCLASAHGTVAQRPVKTTRTAVRERWFNYLDLRCGDRTLLVRREGKDIWQGLFEYPMIETEGPAGFEELQIPFLPEGFILEETVDMPRHVLSHQVIHARFHRIRLDRFPDLPVSYIVATDLDDYPVSRLTELYRER